MVGKTKKQKKSQSVANEVAYMTKEQLKVELKLRGLKSSGSRNELQQRLGNLMATVKRKGEFVAYANGQTESKKPAVIADVMPQRRQEERDEREKIVLWLQPVKTLTYFFIHLCYITSGAIKKSLQHKLTVTLLTVFLLLLMLVLQLDGPHQIYLVPVRKQVLWCLYWLGLGVLSSVGLGTGLHTFVLYLGPHIASVTLAAYECNSLNFPEPPYPDEIMCPDGEAEGDINIFKIMAKVRLEAMMWGAGTALGELPPYFMARAARLSGYDPDDEDDLREFEELQLKKDNPSEMSLIDRAKLSVERMVEKVGFIAILACASIPNPLFDLAGITCGHFLVPFWTFFGATLLGKAVIKMHIQKLFVIVAFNESLLAQAVAWIGLVPYFGLKFQQPLKDFLEKQKMKLHRKSSGDIPEGVNLLSWIFEKLVIAMILYFVVSIINSMAQSHHKRLCKERRNQPKIAKD